MVFREHPGAVLVHLPAGDRVYLSGPTKDGSHIVLQAPIDRGGLARQLERAGVQARVTEGALGPEALAALGELQRGERRERGSVHRQREAVVATVLQSANGATVREHASAMARRQVVDREIREIKARLHRLRMADHDVLKDLRHQLRQLQDESQALQARMGELRRAEEQGDGAWALAQAIREVAPAELAETIMARALVLREGKEDDDGSE